MIGETKPSKEDRLEKRRKWVSDLINTSEDFDLSWKNHNLMRQA